MNSKKRKIIKNKERDWMSSMHRRRSVQNCSWEKSLSIIHKFWYVCILAFLVLVFFLVCSVLVLFSFHLIFLLVFDCLSTLCTLSSFVWSCFSFIFTLIIFVCILEFFSSCTFELVESLICWFYIVYTIWFIILLLCSAWQNLFDIC